MTTDRCPTCGAFDRAMRGQGKGTAGFYEAKPDLSWPRCPDPWHGSQDVEGGSRDVATVRSADGAGTAASGGGPASVGGSPSTTQEAEKALDPWESIELALQYAWQHGDGDYRPALRSLRTLHTEDREAYDRVWRLASQAQVEVDNLQGRIEELEHDQEELLAFLRETSVTMKTGAPGYQMAEIVDNVLRKFDALPKEGMLERDGSNPA